MGLFDKKYCDICGNKIGLFGNRKLENGNLCGDCAKKLSPWFSERRSSTVEEIRAQLEYREMNKESVAQFNTTASYGHIKKLLLDEDKQLFMVASTRNLMEENPDVLSFSQVTGCELDVDEHKTELKTRDAQGNQVSFNPPRYKYSYDFYTVIHVNHPYFDEIRFKLNDDTVSIETPDSSMGGYNQQRPMGAVNRPVQPARPQGQVSPARPQGTVGQRPGAVGNTAARPVSPVQNRPGVNRPGAPSMNRPGVAPNVPAGQPRTVAGRPVNNTGIRPGMGTVQRPQGTIQSVFNQGMYGRNMAYTDADMRAMIQQDGQYMTYQQMGEDIKAILLNIRQNIRDEIQEAAIPRSKVNCPYCGATTIPDENGACEYCGGSLVGLF